MADKLRMAHAELPPTDGELHRATNHLQARLVFASQSEAWMFETALRSIRELRRLRQRLGERPRPQMRNRDGQTT